MKVLTLDIGASSGRIIVYEINGHELKSEETYRFFNGPITKDKTLRWDINEIVSKVEEGLESTLSRYPDVSTIGVDTWGCDYVLLDSNDKIVDLPYCYRDQKVVTIATRFLSTKNHNYYEIYKSSGIQYLSFNTIFQLLRDKRNGVDYSNFLMMPDYINFILAGNKFNEMTNLSTTALYNPIKKEIDNKLLKMVGIDKKVFNKIIEPSKKIGNLQGNLEKYNNIEVVSVGSHDTASAIASIPLDEDSCYLSSGTWSLLGVELKEPLISEESYKANFTNEVGLENTTRFLKNIMGLFIIQELRKDFLSIDPHIDFQKINDSASGIENNDVYIDVDDPLFQTPNHMMDKLNKYLEETNQRKLTTISEISRCVYESMAFKYKVEFNKLETLTNKKYKQIYVVGGGGKATLLNQLIANVLNIKVVVLDSEGTSLGNAIAQFIYKGVFKDLSDARRYLKEVFYPNNETRYLANDVEAYEKKFEKYLEVTKKKQ